MTTKDKKHLNLFNKVIFLNKENSKFGTVEDLKEDLEEYFGCSL